MKNNRWCRAFLLVAVGFLACQARIRVNPYVLMRTELGDIVVEIYSDKAPLTAKNFMRYVDENRFSDAFFYRVVRLDNQPHDAVKIEVVQGGIGFVESDLRLPTIDHESTKKTGVLHEDGVISMARASPGTASSEFFICIGDQPELNFNGKRNPDGGGFAAFGSVVEGMDVVRQIHVGEADGQMLKTPIRITEVRRVKKREMQADSL
ncbi:MAG: peptidylprolyl isomerase [candidate division WOR-3 bacterium]|nr:peptidylprolyl isomerase [candidate division WOR-3 bacterium]